MNALRRLALATACSMALVGPALGAYTSTINGDNLSMVGDAGADTLILTLEGGLLRHNRMGDPGFASALDFDTTLAGVQTKTPTGQILVNSGSGADVVQLGDTTVSASALTDGSIRIQNSGGLSSLVIHLPTDQGEFVHTVNDLTGPGLAIERPSVIGGGVTIRGNQQAQVNVQSTFAGQILFESLFVQRCGKVTVLVSPALAAGVNVTNPPSFTELVVDASGVTDDMSPVYTGSSLSGIAPGTVTWAAGDVRPFTFLMGSGNDTLSVSGSLAAFNSRQTFNLGEGSNSVLVSGGSETCSQVLLGGGGADAFTVNASVASPVEIDGGDGIDMLTYNGEALPVFVRNGQLLRTPKQPVNYTSIETVVAPNTLLITDAYEALDPMALCEAVDPLPYTGRVVVPSGNHLLHRFVVDNGTVEEFSGLSVVANLEQAVPEGQGTIGAGQTVTFDGGCFPISRSVIFPVFVSATRTSDMAMFATEQFTNVIVPPPAIEAWALVPMGNVLHRIRLDDPKNILMEVPVTGLGENVQILAIDLHPRTGELYAVTDSRYFFTIDTGSGVATPLSEEPFEASLLAGAYVGFDIHPLTGDLWLFGQDGKNLVFSSATGEQLPLLNGSITYAAGDPFFGQMLEPQGLAFANALPGFDDFTALAIDGVNKRLLRFEASPAVGSVFSGPAIGSTIGNQIYSMDLAPNGVGIILEQEEQTPPLRGTRLYTVFTADDTFTLSLYEQLDNIYIGIALDPIMPDIFLVENSYPEPASDEEAQIDLALSFAVNYPVRVRLAIRSDSAIQGGDFIWTEDIDVTIPAGQDLVSVPITIKGDNLYEGDETFLAQLSRALGARTSGADTILTIIDDDPLPTVEAVANFSVNEGDGSTATSVTVIRDTQSSVESIVSVEFEDGTALRGVHYEAEDGDYAIPSDGFVLQIPVTILGNTTPEPDRQFTWRITNVTNATLGNTVGTVTIVNDDGAVPTPTASPTPTLTPSATATGTPTGTATATPTGTQTQTPSVTPSTTTSGTPTSGTPTSTSPTTTVPTGTGTPTSPTATSPGTPTGTGTPTSPTTTAPTTATTATPTPTTPVGTVTPSPTASASPTPEPTGAVVRIVLGLDPGTLTEDANGDGILDIADAVAP